MCQAGNPILAKTVGRHLVHQRQLRTLPDPEGRTVIAKCQNSRVIHNVIQAGGSAAITAVYILHFQFQILVPCLEIVDKLFDYPSMFRIWPVNNNKTHYLQFTTSKISASLTYQ